MDGSLAQQLLELNAHMRFGAFAYDPDGELVLYVHSILGGATLDPEELVATVRDVALIADEYDDRIIAKYGGQTMKDLLEEAAFERIMEHDPRPSTSARATTRGSGRDEGARSPRSSTPSGARRS